MVERRFNKQLINLRAADNPEEESRIVDGYAAVYFDPNNAGTEYLMQFGSWTIRERILPGAFDGVLGGDTYCLFNHDASAILGNTSARTCTLSLDERGLFFVCNLPDTTLGEDVRKLVKRGDIRGCSFAFDVQEDAFVEDRENKVAIREIRKISALYDVGPVTYPAYTGTSVQGRSLEQSNANLQQRVEQMEADLQRQNQLRNRILTDRLQRMSSV
jgi:hypothetical protein